MRKFCVSYRPQGSHIPVRERSLDELADCTPRGIARYEGFHQERDSHGGSLVCKNYYGQSKSAMAVVRDPSQNGQRKNAAWLLGNAGYESYLPLIKLTRQWSDDVKNTEAPLFPG